MKNIRKNPQPQSKIHARRENDKRNEGCCSEQHPWFSFKAMTTNKDFNINGLPGGREREQTLVGLFSKLNELSEKEWTQWLNMRNQNGIESLPFQRLQFKPNSSVTLTEDTTVYVIRFDTYKGSGKGRIIGYKDGKCAVLHIIGFDFNFKAYDHG